ncbi:MAG: alpha-mannosidase [Janthinobacterium lividum]
MPIPISPEITQGPQITRIDHAMACLPEHIYRPLADLTAEAWVTSEPVPFADRQAGTRQEVKKGNVWGKLWDCAWFHFTGTVPSEANGEKIVLLIDLNGEGCVVDGDGTPVQGLTAIRSGFDYSLGRPGKHVVPFADHAQGGDTVDLWVDAGNNDLFGGLPEGGALAEASIAIRRDEVQALCFDFQVLRELLEFLPKNKARYARVLQALYDVALSLPQRGAPTDEQVAAARARLAPELARRGGDPALTVSAVGHAHIDLAWLWPLRETIRKGARTFSTALRMMERYPDYVFGASQPQLYQWMKDYYPSLYSQIKARVAEGRWEVQGAMWVEPDANIPSGEALVRQILYGKRFFRDEFGVDVTNLWMPDVFGYSGSLPQILKAAGLSTFLTQKLSWSEVNTFPHHTFHWEGIDGSRVLVHMPPEGTYNSSAAPRAIARAEENFLDKAVSDRVLVLFGIGDGGGGPGEEHLERLAREKDLQGLAPVVQEPAAAFFDHLLLHAENYPVWRGELYLEKHQGTLTTQARNKRFNRQLEIALRELELSAVRAMLSSSAPYPSAALDRIWKEMLLLQFHDILPGSSITRVYDESRPRYAALLAEVAELTAASDRASLGTGESTLALNSLSWDREEWLNVDGQWRFVSVPAFGTAVIADTSETSSATVSASKHALENEALRVEFGEAGDLISLYDKLNNRETLKIGEIGNALTVYEDFGDAWDFSSDYASVPSLSCPLTASEAWIDGPKAVLKQTRRCGDSTITQEISLTAGNKHLEFATHVDWRENNRMLRTYFPVAVNAEVARCEIQFGNIARPTTSNTTWETAKFEVCGHKWVDVSEESYGVALLNDCKYGHSVQNGALGLTLLRSPSHPDPTADRAEHDFTYALLPHAGDYVSGEVVREAYALNIPLRVASGSASQMPLLSVEGNGVIVEAIKKAEDCDAVVVRLYEAHGASTQAALRFGFPVRSVSRIDLMEENLSIVEVAGDTAVLLFSPFEIVTLLVEPLSIL